MSTKLKFFLPCLLIALVADQISKQMIIAKFHYAERLVLIPGLLDFTHVRNPGGAFSFFADGPIEQRMVFFIGTTLIAIVLLLVFFRQLEPGSRAAPFSLGLILGGAVGNLIDRIVHWEVIDFIDVHLWGGYTWPTFNLADSFIVVGVSILVVEIFMEQDEPQPDGASAGPPAA